MRISDWSSDVCSSDLGAIHFLVDLLAEILVGRIWERAATPTPDWRGCHAGAGTPRAFLTPGLFGRMLDIIAALLGAIAAAGIGLECNHDLVHERFVEVAAKYGIRRGNGGGGLALIIQELEFHGLCSFSGRRFAGWKDKDRKR